MNIRVDLYTPIKDGQEVVFRSPVDCSQITGLKVYYRNGDGSADFKEFAFADAHGNNVGDIDHLFAENAVVKVILDVTTNMAFVQNADTNAYLEGKFAERSPNYYHTEREELDANYPPIPSEFGKDGNGGYMALHNCINALGEQYVYKLYDALVDQYKIVNKKTGEITYQHIAPNDLKDNDGDVVLREYIINCNTDGIYAKQYGFDDPARKPKYLIISGIHGSERNAVFSTYRFVRDIVNGHNVPKAFRDGAVIHVIPVANPVAFKAFEYNVGSGVDKNFDWNWQEGKDAEQEKEDGTPEVYGDAAADKPETQAITKWLHENSDAVAFINYHNNGFIHENVAIIAPSDDGSDRVKRAAMRGIDRVIPYWRDVIGYPNVETILYWSDTEQEFLTADKPVVFSYSAEYVTPASSTGYALNVLGIPSIYMETSAYYGNFSDWWDYSVPGAIGRGAGKPTYQPEVIAMGAEALGNILIELFSEASEVKDMAGVNDKLDTLIEGDMVEVQNKLDALMGQINSGFHAVSGVFRVDGKGEYPGEGQLNVVVLRCPPHPKMLIFQPDAGTLERINQQTSRHTLGFRVVFAGESTHKDDKRCVATVLAPYNGNMIVQQGATIAVDADDGVYAQCFELLGGTYNWTAYYWNEGEAIPAWTGGSY